MITDEGDLPVSLPGGGRQKSHSWKAVPAKPVRPRKPCSRLNRIWPIDGDQKARSPPILTIAPNDPQWSRRNNSTGSSDAVEISGLGNADDRADLEVRAVGKDVVAISHAPFVTPWRRFQMMLPIINRLCALPIFMFDRSSLSPFLMFDILLLIVVMVLGDGDAATKAG